MSAYNMSAVALPPSQIWAGAIGTLAAARAASSTDSKPVAGGNAALRAEIKEHFVLPAVSRQHKATASALFMLEWLRKARHANAPKELTPEKAYRRRRPL
jgi:hypothetical protein